jgi:hypothetical protein
MESRDSWLERKVLQFFIAKREFSLHPQLTAERQLCVHTMSLHTQYLLNG